MNIKPTLEKILQELCTQKMKANKTMREQGVLTHRRKDK
jgi:hypothetical protein